MWARDVTDDDALPLYHFTQRDVMTQQVVYVPPRDDTGCQNRSVIFKLTVTNPDGSGSHLDQLFHVTILPVNNRAPDIKLGDVTVMEGGDVILSTNQIAASDRDSSEHVLMFTVKVVPKHGMLLFDDQPLVWGEIFSYENLKDEKIR